MGSADIVTVNRAPVLTLWAAVVAERLGYAPDEALSLAKAVAGLNAQAKGRRLGVYGQPAAAPGEAGAVPEGGRGEEFWVTLCDRPVPAVRTERGIRAVNLDKPIEPEPVRKYLSTKFGADLERTRAALDELAAAYDPSELESAAYGLYERLRPTIPPGKRGWGQKGALDLERIRSMARAKLG